MCAVDILELVRRAVSIEAKAVGALVKQVDQSYANAIALMRQCQGKVVVSGIGKSGLVGRKMAASLASTGTPAFFVPRLKQFMVTPGWLSGTMWSSCSPTVAKPANLNFLPILEQIGCKKVAITNNPKSTLARSCDVAIVYSYEREADHLNLAPTTSATLTMVIGDALATTLSILKEFDRKDFYLYHPGGSLGTQLAQEQSR